MNPELRSIGLAISAKYGAKPASAPEETDEQRANAWTKVKRMAPKERERFLVGWVMKTHGKRRMRRRLW